MSFSYSLLFECYTVNLTRIACQQSAAHPPEYGTYVTAIFQTLLRKTTSKYNPLLLEQDEQHRLGIITEAVRQMATGEAPDPLSTWRVISLNYEALFAPIGSSPADDFLLTQKPHIEAQETEITSLKPANHLKKAFPSRNLKQIQDGDWQIALARLQGLIMAIRRSEQKIILFADHFHWLLGGDSVPYAFDAASLLVPALARREVQIIGACTFNQYQEHIQYFAAIERRCKEIPISL
jgi:hypothetical protein